MKSLRIVIAVLALSLMALTSVIAQTAVPPPPKPADSGPSLAATMQFIQDKLNQIGEVNYVAYLHDNVAGTSWSNQFSNKISNVIANPLTCRISFHGKATRDTTVISDKDVWFPLHDVRNIKVMTAEQNLKKLAAAAEHPSWDSKADPPTFVLVAYGPEKAEVAFDFSDEEITNRVAKAMVHAVELCGGGNKDPF